MLLLACSPGLTRAESLNHPTGTDGLIMVDKLGSMIRFFDPRTDRELQSFASSDTAAMRPHELAISPDHKHAYVTLYGDGIFGKNPNPGHAIAIIDLKSHSLVGSIDVSPYRAPHGIQVDARGNLYVVCDLDHKLLIIDPADKKIIATIDVGAAGHWIALMPNASKAYISNHGDQPFLSVIDLKTRRLSAKIPIAHSAYGIALSPDGQTLLAADFLEPYLHVISTATDLEVSTVPVQDATKGLYKVFYSADGKHVLTTLRDGHINIFDANDLHAPQRILHSPGTTLMGFAFAADGHTVLAANHYEGTATKFDVNSAAIENTFPVGTGVETLAFY